MSVTGHRPPQKVRKQYKNTEHPMVILRFEDGHEIKVYQGSGKEFDCWPLETIKLLVLYDPTSNERELLESRKSEQFEDVKA